MKKKIAPSYTSLSKYLDNNIKDPADYFRWCNGMNLEPDFLGDMMVIKMADGRPVEPIFAELSHEYFTMASMKYDMARGVLKQPVVKHDDPADYGLTREAAIRSRLRFLHIQLKREQCLFNTVQRELLTKYDKWTEQQLCVSGTNLDAIRKQILGENNRLKHPGATRKSYDIAAIKRIPMDTITQINSNRFFQINPFRQENSPSNSLYWYKEKNRFCDFATNQTGDIVDLMMAISKCSMIEALKALSSC